MGKFLRPPSRMNAVDQNSFCSEQELVRSPLRGLLSIFIMERTRLNRILSGAGGIGQNFSMIALYGMDRIPTRMGTIGLTCFKE